MSGAGDDDSMGSDGDSEGSGGMVTNGTAAAPGGEGVEEDKSASEEAQV